MGQTAPGGADQSGTDPGIADEGRPGATLLHARADTALKPLRISVPFNELANPIKGKSYDEKLSCEIKMLRVAKISLSLNALPPVMRGAHRAGSVANFCAPVV